MVHKRCRMKLQPGSWTKAIQKKGEWIGVRVLRRIDNDGTHWVIRRAPDGEMWTLLCFYRDHTLSSTHTSIQAAKTHRDNVTASWRAARLHDYQRQATGVR